MKPEVVPSSLLIRNVNPLVTMDGTAPVDSSASNLRAGCAPSAPSKLLPVLPYRD